MKIRSRIGEIIDDAVHVTRRDEQQGTQRNNAAEVARRAQQQGEDVQVELGLGRALKNELDITDMLAERREHFERIKSLVQSGQYKLPPSEEIAKRLAEEIGFEVDLAKVAGDEE